MYGAGCGRSIFLIYSGLGELHRLLLLVPPLLLGWAGQDSAATAGRRGLIFNIIWVWLQLMGLVALCFAAWSRASIYTGARYKMQARLGHNTDLSAQLISPRVFRNEAKLQPPAQKPFRGHIAITHTVKALSSQLPDPLVRLPTAERGCSMYECLLERSPSPAAPSSPSSPS